MANLDALTGFHIMGFPRCPEDWHPSYDKTQAHELLEKLHEAGVVSGVYDKDGPVIEDEEKQRGPTVHVAWAGEGADKVEAEAATTEVAICLLALKLKGVEVE